MHCFSKTKKLKKQPLAYNDKIIKFRGFSRNHYTLLVKAQYETHFNERDKAYSYSIFRMFYPELCGLFL